MQSECLILLKSKKVGAEQQFAKCSIEDFDFLNKLSWYKSQDGYVKTMSIIMGETSMHRIVCKLQGIELPKNCGVDHIHGDKLDNRREMLRVATRAQNSQNKRKRSNTSSSWYGVSFKKKQNVLTSEYKFTKLIL
ncbi:MAG: HNH endonuclease [Nitrosomonas sp.]|nr:HNH endonuclease [Nitrosomonas sp.]